MGKKFAMELKKVTSPPICNIMHWFLHYVTNTF